MNHEFQGNLQRQCDEAWATIAKICDAVAADCEAAGIALAQEFRARREALQKEAEAELTANQPLGSRPITTYSPLALFSRFHHGTLQIYWQQVHRPRGSKKPRYQYMRKGGRSANGYDMQSLMAASKDFEKELVRETEMRANDIRREWRKLMEIRQSLRMTTVHWKQETTPEPSRPDQKWQATSDTTR